MRKDVVTIEREQSASCMMSGEKELPGAKVGLLRDEQVLLWRDSGLHLECGLVLKGKLEGGATQSKFIEEFISRLEIDMFSKIIVMIKKEIIFQSILKTESYINTSCLFFILLLYFYFIGEIFN